MIPEISHFRKYDRYMSWIFHTYDTIQIPDGARGPDSQGRRMPKTGNHKTGPDDVPLGQFSSSSAASAPLRS